LDSASLSSSAHCLYSCCMARPTNALIVDDEAHVRAFMRLLLRELGINECWEAGEGVSALQLAQAHSPQLILLDINMPGLNGLQILAQLKEVNPDFAVVMATSQRALNNVSEALRLGAVGYLIKHAPKDETLGALRDILDTLEDEDGEAADEKA
jgi:two-component system, chemotaxis family, chemotaxis protein CheY